MCLSIRHLTAGAHIRITLTHIIIRTVRGITAAAGTGTTGTGMTGIGTTGTGTTGITDTVRARTLTTAGIRTGTRVITARPMPAEGTTPRIPAHLPEVQEQAPACVRQALLLRHRLQREAALLHLITGLLLPEAPPLRPAPREALTEVLLLQAVRTVRHTEVQAAPRGVRLAPCAARPAVRGALRTAAAEHREVAGRI